MPTPESVAPAANDALVSEILKGAVDLHCHSGPSVMPRRLDHLDALKEAAAAGFRAVLLKDHYYPIAPLVELIKKHYPDLGVIPLSGVPLNNPTGGINRFAVDHGIKLGARLVWMPTFSAANHIAHHSHGKTSNFPTAKEQMLAPVPLTALDDKGQVLDEVKVVLDLVAEGDLVLSGGHLNIKEIWPVFEEAKKRGVKRFLVNHPTFVLDAGVKDIKELVAFGAYIEHSICMFIDCRFKEFEPEELKKLIDAGTVERTILGSDLGQVGNPTPVEGFRSVVQLCLKIGYSADQIKQMVAVNPAKLIGLD